MYLQRIGSYIKDSNSNISYKFCLDYKTSSTLPHKLPTVALARNWFLHQGRLQIPVYLKRDHTAVWMPASWISRLELRFTLTGSAAMLCNITLHILLVITRKYTLRSCQFHYRKNTFISMNLHSFFFSLQFH